MNIFGSVLIVVLFVVLLRALKLVARSRQVVSLSQESLSIVSDKQLSDDEKEAQLQKHSLALMALFGILVVGSAVALGAPIGVVWGLDKLGMMSFDGVMAVLVSWPFLLASTVLGTGAYILLSRLSS